MAYTVTATEGANAVNGIVLRVKVLTGAAPAASQAGAVKTADTTASPFFDQSVTTTAAGSVVYGAMANGVVNTAFTADARTTKIDDIPDAVQVCEYLTWRATSATGTPGATVLGASAPTNDHGTYAAAEILAAGTIAEDSSGPAGASSTAASAVTTASFTPPPGSLLVAMAAHCSSAVSSVTISNTGGTLAWRQLAYLSTSAGTGSGIWVADVPAAAVPAAAAARPGKTWLRRFRRRPVPAAVPLPGPAAGGALLDGSGSLLAAVPVAAPASLSGSGSLSAAAARYITGLGGTGAGYFTDNTGLPRMVLGDAAWALPGNAGRWNSGNWQGDYDTFLANRAAQGFTVIYAKPIGTTQSGCLDDFGKTFDSLYPFQGGTPATGVSGANPSSGLTSAFWARIDYFLNSALGKGVTVFLNAIGYSSDFDSGPGPLAGKSSAEFQAYGAALGARYASQPNLIWNLADDYFGSVDTKISAFLTGLRGAGDSHPVSIENYPESTSRQDLPAGTALPWGTSNAQFNFVYSYNVTYYGVEKAYLESSPVPVIWGDGYFYQGGSGGSYQGGTGAFAYDHAMRQDAWHAVSSGARGWVNGSEGIWQYQSTALAASALEWWYVNGAGKIRQYVESLPGWYNLVPDTSSALVTGGRGTHASSLASGGGGGQYEVAFTDSYVTASRCADKSLAVIYLSHATTITIDQTQMSAGYTATWVDPLTLATSAATPGSTYNSTAKGSNSAGEADWVLVLQVPPATSGGATLSGSGSLTAAGTVTAPAALSGSGTLSASAAVTAPASLSGSGSLAAAAVLTGAAGLSGSGSLSAAGVITVPGTASLSGSGVLAAAAAVTAPAGLSGSGTASTSPGATTAPAALSGSGTLSAAAQVTAPAALSGSGTASAGAAVTAAAGLSGSGALSASPSGTTPGAAALDGSGSLAAAAAVTAPASLSGSGTLAAGATAIPAAGLSGSGSLAAAAAASPPAALSGSGTLAAALAVTAPAVLSGSGTLTANAGGNVTGTASLTGTGTLTAAAAVAVTAALSGSGTLAAAAAVTSPAALSGSGTLAASPSGTTAGTAALSGSGTLAAAAALPGSASLTGSGALSAAALTPGAAALSGTGSLSAGTSLTAPAALTGSGSLSAGTVLVLTASVSLAGSGTLTVSARVILPVTEPPVLWSARPAALRWQAAPCPPRWGVTPSALRWRLLMALFPPIAAISLEYVNVTWLSDLDGTAVDPTGQTAGQPVLPVQFAFPQTSGNYAEPAQPVTWFTGSWLLGGTGRGYVSQALVGPGGVVTLTAGLGFDCWTRVSGSPESPAKFAGTIEVY